MAPIKKVKTIMRDSAATGSMPDITPEPKARQSRFFLYQHNGHVVIGKQTVRYEPNVSKDMFGTVVVEVMFPKKREIKHGFRLSLYPEARDSIGSDVRLNIVDAKVGIDMLLLEVNRSAALQVRSILSIRREDFSYDDMSIISTEDIERNAKGLFMFRGVMLKKYQHLRVGDAIPISDCIEDTTQPNKMCWLGKWEPRLMRDNLKEKILKLYRKYISMDKATYDTRYHTTVDVHIPPEYIKIVAGNPVEAGTDRSEEMG